MKVRETLKQRDRGILERQFVRQVLTEESSELVTKHRQAIASLLKQHTGGTLGKLTSSVSVSGKYGGALTVVHTKHQRFLDMKSRTNKEGHRVKKRAYPIHNRIIFGHLNNIIGQLNFGFTEAVREKIQREMTIPVSS